MKQIMLYTDIARNACGAEKLRSQLLENEGNLVGEGGGYYDHNSHTSTTRYLESTNTSFRCRTHVKNLTHLGHFCMRVSTVSLKKKKKIQNTIGTREQEELNILSQNKESIHALNGNNAFEN